MGDIYLGSLMLVPYTFDPLGFVSCDGRMLYVTQNTALFALLGNRFGGDGKTTFALPDLRGRIPVGANAAHPFAEASGTETVTLETATVPAHSHVVRVTSASATTTVVAGAALAKPANPIYTNTPSSPPDGPMDANMFWIVGDHQPHDNMMPFQALRWVICVSGLFPIRS
jgi:microcystin-dependent protein